MKKIINYIIFTIILLIPVIYAQAFTRLRTPNQYPIVGEEIELNLEINYGKEVKIVSAYYEIEYDTTKFEYTGIIWSQSVEELDTSTPGVIKIRKPAGNGYWDYGDVAILKMKVIGSGKTKIHVSAPERAYYDTGNPVDQTLSDITFSIKEPDTTTKVGTLYVKGHSISPTFNQEVLEYTLKVKSDVESVEVVAKPKNATQTITGDGTRKLIYGDNLVKVKVTAQNGDSTTYRIMITREDNRSSETSLTMLDVSNTEIRYEEGKYVYDTEVPKSIDKVLISAKAKDPKATITGMGEKTLEFGKNTFVIEVKSSSGQTQKYTFNIDRSRIEFQSSNMGTKLLALTINGEKLDVLTKNKFNYINKTGSNTVDVEALTRSATARATITGNKNLKDGPNTVQIIVKESTGATEEYYIYVYNFSNPSQELTSLNINFDPIKDDRFFLTETDQTLPEGLIRSIKTNDYKFSYGKKTGNSLEFLAKIDKNVPQEAIDIKVKRVEKQALPTYNIESPEDTEISLYVGEEFEDNQILRVYSYDEEGKYREVTPGTQVMGGYITFNTNGQKNYLLTVEQLIQVETTIQEYIEQYKEIIAYSILGLLVIVIVVKILQYIKIRSKRKI